MISVQGVTKRYGDTVAVSDVSFDVPRGRVVGFLGPNGAGKSTTMKILTGFMSPTAGRVTVDGHDMFDEPMAAKALIGYLPEVPPLYGAMVVDDFLRFAAELRGVPRRAAPEAVDAAVEAAGLDRVRSRIIDHLSKGYRQRVGIAQALVHSPPVLVLDEPTAGLDPVQIIEIRDLISSLAGERTVILSTHILPEVSAVCEHVIMIHQGRVVADGPLDEVWRSVETVARIHLTVGGPAAEAAAALSAVPGVETVDVTGEEEGRARLEVVPREGADPRSLLSLALAERGWPVLELRPPGLTLEETFVRLTMTRNAEAAP